IGEQMLLWICARPSVAHNKMIRVSFARWGRGGMGNFLARLKCHSIVAAGAAASALVFSLAGTTPASAGKNDNTLRFASQDVPGSINPYYDINRLVVILADQIWDTLIYRDPDSGEFKSNLATAWRWINDTTLELELRQGVKFHN